MTSVLIRPTLDLSIPAATLSPSLRHQGIDDLSDSDRDGEDHLTYTYKRSARQQCAERSRNNRSKTALQDNHNGIGRTTDKHLDDSSYAQGDIVSITLPTLIPASTSPRTRHLLLSRYHSISESIQEEEHDMAETVAVDTAPNSPPALSYSKSSKSSSSSLRSSSIDEQDDDSANDSPHFEELSLDEPDTASLDSHVLEDNNLKPESRPTLKRPVSRNTPLYRSNTASPSYFSQQQPPPTDRGIRSPLAEQSQNLPPRRDMRRGFTSRSTPDINTFLGQRRPSDASGYSSGSVPPSPQSVGSITPRASQDGLPQFHPHMVTRKSWQSTRKTVKELEAEYNDDDEEVPEEAILENVPISPIPGMLRRDSRTPSPRRPPLSPSYTNLHSANVPKNARRPSAPPARSPRSPHLRRPPTLQHSNTAPEAPTYSRKQRSKSWSDDLNDEARQLSAALEVHAEKMATGPLRPGSSSASNSPLRQSELSRKSSMTSILELPPVQKGNVMIDPLPVSKEKEAVLTRTRPSWLPPKSQKEEKKHLKEWQRMMARAQAAERKRITEEHDAVEECQDTQIGIESVWELDILANWGTVRNETRAKELCWQGIAPSSRGAVWMRAIGNELGLTATSFQAALNRARVLEEKLDGLPAEELARSKEAAWFSAIERDVPSAFSSLNKFATGTPANQALSDVLKAFAMYRSDVGYVYGTHLIAGLLCLNAKPADAFITLANLLNRPLPLAFLVHDQTAMLKAHSHVLEALKKKHAKLHAHLTDPTLDLMPEEYLDPLFRCLFAYNLTAEETGRLWDVYAFFGDQVLINAAVALLTLLGPKLYCGKKEIISTIGWRNQKYWNVGEDALIAAIKAARS